MADKPILFSGPMVRALLAGTKTQTRRAINTKAGRRPNLFDGTWADDYVLDPGNEDWRQASLRIKVGDRLYVREAWRCNGWATDVATIMYRASEGDGYTAMTEQFPVDGKKYQRVTGAWRPGIHMPRWASRITLTVTDVRVQRLQDISTEDAEAEGIELTRMDERWGKLWRNYMGEVEGYTDRSAIYSYSTLWASINGWDSWKANPWVAAYTFTVERRNIDQAAAA